MIRLGTPRRAREGGQVLVFAALLLPILLAMAGMAVDVGSYADDKRTLQNAADAIALAAAQNLCTPNPADCSDTRPALAAAQAYAINNKIDPSAMTVTFDHVEVTPMGNPTVHVSLSRNHSFTVMRIVGVNSRDVGAAAAAIKTSPGGMSGLKPWAVVYPPPASGTTATLKYDANNPQNGNFQAIQLDNTLGNGSPTYQNTIQFGSASIVCAQGVTTCATTSPVCPSYDVCPSETGNKVSATRSGVDYLLNNTSASCSTFAQVFGAPDAYGQYTLNPDCNPWTSGPGACPTPDTVPPAQCSRRVIVIPVVTGFGNGKSPVTIVSFALFWLQGYGAGGCTGSSCDITGTFVNAEVTVNALTGVYDAASAIHFVRLTQ